MLNRFNLWFSKGECGFVCGLPDCDAEWSFEVVCKMALLSPEEVEEFEKKIFSNAARSYLDVKAVSISFRSHIH